MDSILKSKVLAAVAGVFPEAVNSVAGHPDRGELRFSQLTPDASMRSYYRIFLSNSRVASIILMVFHSVSCPEYEGEPKVPSDESFVQLSHIFSAAGLPVPELYADHRQDSFLLLEDVGDGLLASFLNLTIEDGTNKLPNREPDVIRRYFREAASLIISLQNVPSSSSCCAYQRKFSSAVYQKEMGEFIEFSCAGVLSIDELKLLSSFFSELSGLLVNMKQVLAHRDYHGWNLVVDSKGSLRILDFQDALVATRFYDLVALINDRDVDSALGAPLYREILEYFVRLIEQQELTEMGLAASESNRDSTLKLLNEYDLVLLQRDFKVAGRFAKLVNLRKLDRYQQWIPGTQRRLGRTLARVVRENQIPTLVELSGRVLEVLTKKFPDISQGAGEDSWY